MRKPAKNFTDSEVRNIKAFVSAAIRWAGGQSELAAITKLSQPTINMLKAGARGAGGKSLRNLAAATKTSIDDILSGAAVYQIAVAGVNGATEAAKARLVALDAVARLYGITIGDVDAVLDELGIEFPDGVGARALFDVARAAIDRKRAGLEISRRISG